MTLEEAIKKIEGSWGVSGLKSTALEALKDAAARIQRLEAIVKELDEWSKSQ
jgi:hypothetical protein